MNEKIYEIWTEGYHVMECSATAKLLGKAKGKDFKDVIKNFFDKNERVIKVLCDVENLTYWGCKLFDNEIDARERFG